MWTCCGRSRTLPSLTRSRRRRWRLPGCWHRGRTSSRFQAPSGAAFSSRTPRPLPFLLRLRRLRSLRRRFRPARPRARDIRRSRWVRLGSDGGAPRQAQAAGGPNPLLRHHIAWRRNLDRRRIRALTWVAGRGTRAHEVPVRVPSQNAVVDPERHFHRVDHLRFALSFGPVYLVGGCLCRLGPFQFHPGFPSDRSHVCLRLSPLGGLHGRIVLRPLDGPLRPERADDGPVSTIERLADIAVVALNDPVRLPPPPPFLPNLYSP